VFGSQENISRLLKSAGKRRTLTLHVCMYFWLFIALAEAGVISLTAALTVSIKDPGNTTSTVVWVIISLVFIIGSLLIAMILRVRFCQAQMDTTTQCQPESELPRRRTDNLRGDSNSSGDSAVRSRTPRSIFSVPGQVANKEALKKHKDQLQSALLSLEARISGGRSETEELVASPIEEPDLGFTRLSILHEREHDSGPDKVPYGTHDTSITTLAMGNSTARDNASNTDTPLVESREFDHNLLQRQDSLVDPLPCSVPFSQISNSHHRTRALPPSTSLSVPQNSSLDETPRHQSPSTYLPSSSSMLPKLSLHSKMSPPLDTSVLRSMNEEERREYFERRRDEHVGERGGCARDVSTGEGDLRPWQERLDEKIRSPRDSGPYGAVSNAAGDDAGSFAEIYRSEIGRLDDEM
jgi:hypothetical protein